MIERRRMQAGQSIEDFCRACKTDRMHTVIVVDSDGVPLRVMCGYCRSEHGFRGGPRISVERNGGEDRRPPAAPLRPRAAAPTALPIPIAGEHDTTGVPMATVDDAAGLERLLRRIIREEAGVTPVVPAARWRGGTMVLRPATPGLQEKTIPIDTLFHKVVMVRNRLRTLEQQVNASDLPDDAKVKLQSYITGCYGSLTTFNILFADEDDQFSGTGGD